MLEEKCFTPANGVTELSSHDFRQLIASDALKATLMYTQNKIKILKGHVTDIAKFRGYFETQ